jgi:hypothetical protein
MNLLTILFLLSSALSGVVVMGIGIAKLPQPSTTYIEGSGDSAESIAKKNQEIIINSYEFKLVLIGTGLIFLALCVLVWAKHRDEQLRIIDETRLERKRVQEYQLNLEKEAAKNKSPVQQLVQKSAELDSNTTVVSSNTVANTVPNQNIMQTNRPINPVIETRPRPILNTQRTNFPKPILKQIGVNSIVQQSGPYTQQRSYYPPSYYPHPYNTVYPRYNRPVIEYIKY